MENEEVFFKWKPEYSVNIKTIDAQHQELVNILNRLFVAVSMREGDKAIAGILDALTSYTQTHFALEERLMREAKYKDLEPHMAEHRKLLEELDRLAKKFMLEEKPIYFEMLGFLKSWLKGHILGVDTKYSAALQEAGFVFDTWEREATAEFAAMSNSKKWWELWKAA
ncbi:MAG: bacteriohemerythrin [Gammaproteobacteria bacterium]|nr:bacteriohemerythrin [Gammaproteobacteria bacterium]MBU1776532.1 bacteriohemerythrin [Gammaproteobacteria bacterium]MBU1969423.1 bacteriohemerythrin [Gammaproteobacteria bacterium]